VGGDKSNDCACLPEHLGDHAIAVPEGGIATSGLEQRVDAVVVEEARGDQLELIDAHEAVPSGGCGQRST